ncbi:DedA family protein [Marisediminicola senii]|uniref:DedA family protein n=1 Tax=Marisediminicola senii TaxID=2711233 RepID=UPI0013EDAE03|nr:VTT domain-containing protein [Marisediminicola senii]
MTPHLFGLDFLDAEWLITWFGPFVLLGVAAIVFVETALIVLSFLPGDSLLFTVGLLTATGFIPYPILVTCIIIFIAAFAGDQVAYFIGRKAGPAVFAKEKSRLFNPSNVDRTNEFFVKYGGKAVIIARFLPVFRAFVPVAAGIGKMKYRTFITFNAIGAFAWGVGLTLIGYFLGQIQFVQDYAEYIIIGIVLLSGVPILLELSKAARSNFGAKGKAARLAAAAQVENSIPEELKDQRP